MKKLKTGIFSFAHPHISALMKLLEQRPDVFEVIGFAEVSPYSEEKFEKHCAKMAEKFPEAKRFDNWTDLADAGLDFAVVTSDNASRREVCCALLSRGIHVIDEKPMAPLFEDAAAMVTCAKENGVRMLTNWPIAWFPSFNLAKQLLDEGRIGKLMRSVYRSPATWGPFSYSKDGLLPPEEELLQTWWYQAHRGGGSILDYACYGAALSTWMFGHAADRVACLSKQFATGFSDVEDYSAMLLDFGEGVGLLEGSWSTYNPAEIPSGPVLYGTDGVIVCDRHSNVLKLYAGRSHAWVAPTEIIELPKPDVSALSAESVVACLVEGKEPHPMLAEELNLNVVAALDAGARSAKTGVTETVRRLTL